MNFQNANIVTAAEMRAIDRATSERFGVPSLTLMENAGTAVATHILESYPSAKKITVFCGKGNNGGDGFVAARRLREAGKTVHIILLAAPEDLRGDAAAMFSKLTPSKLTKSKLTHSKLTTEPLVVRSGEELKSDRAQAVLSADLYLDAILGTGFKPPVTGLYAAAIAILNAGKIPVVAVDIPSGADADAMAPQKAAPERPIARADSIATFTAPRPAHVFSQMTTGITIVSDIGSPQEAIPPSSLKLHVITPQLFDSILAPRQLDSNKGLYGHVVVIGGALGKSGAAAMAGMSALRAGAGLSTVAIPKSVLPTVAGFHPELMTEPLPETDLGTIASQAQERIVEIIKGISTPTIAIGPGISRAPETSALVRSLVTRFKSPMVVDADGLNAFQENIDELNGAGRTLVITPHPGEMARLAGCTTAEVQKNRLAVARKFARDHNLIVVLKGYRTIVTAGQKLDQAQAHQQDHAHEENAWINMTGNPGMATGGTGDILTGMVAGLIAQHPKNVLMAVCAAVHLHGLAGDVARESKGELSLVATDLLDALPEAIRRAQRVSHEHSMRWEG